MFNIGTIVTGLVLTVLAGICIKLYSEDLGWAVIWLLFAAAVLAYAVQFLLEKKHKSKVFQTIDERRKAKKYRRAVGVVDTIIPLSEREQIDTADIVAKALNSGKYTEVKGIWKN